MEKAIFWKEEEELFKVLERAQKGCRTRLCDYTDIEYAVEYLDKVFGRIPKCHRKGLTVQINKHAQQFASSYRGVPSSTYFTVVYQQKGWYVKDIKRQPCGSVKFRTIVMPEEAQQALIRSYMKL